MLKTHYSQYRNLCSNGRFSENGLLIAVPIENVQEIWPTKMDFGRPNAKIGRKMANGRMLFLALLTLHYNSAIIGKHHTQNINHQ